MASIILFRFYAEFELCAERLKLLRTLNPDVPIYGMFGGPPTTSATAAQTLGSLLEGIYTIPSVRTNWKILHEDLTLARWFADVGHGIAFDVLYDVHYDLLLTEPLSQIYPAIDQESVAVSGLQYLEVVRPTWYWTSTGTFPQSVDRYLRYLQRRFGVHQRFVSQGPFPLLPRRFVEAMSGLEYPDDIFEDIVVELSLPGLAESLGFAMVDTGLHPPWTPGPPVCRLFHCEKRPPITVEQIAAELASASGRRAFHPVKTFIACENLLQLRR
jgi:hypothetical protein